MSPEMASKLGVLIDHAIATLPPPPPKPPEVQDEGSPEVVRMDPFIVEEERPPDLKERHILTKKGTDALMQKQYPALQNLGPIPLFNGVKVREIREDDLRKERRLEMGELYGRLGAPSPAAKKAVDEMRSRPSDPRPQNGTPFKEPQR